MIRWLSVVSIPIGAIEAHYETHALHLVELFQFQ